jgi:hypothetical protein
VTSHLETLGSFRKDKSKDLSISDPQIKCEDNFVGQSPIRKTSRFGSPDKLTKLQQELDTERQLTQDIKDDLLLTTRELNEVC